MASKIISFRIKPEEMAKALEGLLENNTDPSNLTTISGIVRTTFYHGIISLCENPHDPASEEARQKINQLLNQNKRTKTVGLRKLLNKNMD